MMTSLQLDTSLPAVEEQGRQKEKDTEPAEDRDTHTASTTPTRIPHPSVAHFRRSASLRLRGNPPPELGLRPEHCPAGGGGFSSRAKLSAIPSSLKSRSHPVHLRRNRSWSNLGHKTEQEPEVKASTEAAPESESSGHALCHATQCLSLAEDKQMTNCNMANGKPRNLVSCRWSRYGYIVFCIDFHLPLLTYVTCSRRTALAKRAKGYEGVVIHMLARTRSLKYKYYETIWGTLEAFPRNSGAVLIHSHNEDKICLLTS